jgi:hypothetical protein
VWRRGEGCVYDSGSRLERKIMLLLRVCVHEREEEREGEREEKRDRERDLRQQVHQVFDEIPLSKQKITSQSLCGFVGELVLMIFTTAVK